MFKSLDRNISSLNSTRSRWSSSETWAAGSSNSSGGTEITTPYNPSMSLRASLGFRQQQQEKGERNSKHSKEEAVAGGDEAMPDDPAEHTRQASEAETNVERERPLHMPGHPNHSHPGSSAIVADYQYQKEEAQRSAMLRHDSSLSTLPDESDV